MQAFCQKNLLFAQKFIFIKKADKKAAQSACHTPRYVKFYHAIKNSRSSLHFFRQDTEKTVKRTNRSAQKKGFFSKKHLANRPPMVYNI